MTALAILTFTIAACVSVAAIVGTVAPQWARIVELLERGL